MELNLACKGSTFYRAIVKNSIGLKACVNFSFNSDSSDLAEEIDFNCDTSPITTVYCYEPKQAEQHNCDNFMSACVRLRMFKSHACQVLLLWADGADALV